MNISGYTRISVDIEQDRDNTSIENQKAIISDYVATYFPQAKLTLYEDRDRSGYTFEQREGYQQMRPKLFSGESQILIIKDFSRFPGGIALVCWSWRPCATRACGLSLSTTALTTPPRTTGC